MDLVHDVDLVGGLRWSISHLLQQVTDVVHTGVRGGIDLNQIHQPAIVDRLADLALVAGAFVGWGLAVDGFGDEARGRCLSGAAGPSEQIRVVDVPGAQRMAQRPDNMLLTDDVVERLGTPSAVKGLRHRCLL